jgi:hypothetical protein
MALTQITEKGIKDGEIINADINASAAIALSKLATGALPTGITIARDNLNSSIIKNSEVHASAAIARTKLANVDLVDDTSPQLGGNLNLNSNAIEGTGSISITGNIDAGTGNFLTNDNGKFISGTAGDLQIYHSGVNSVIDNNTGGLYIRNNVGGDVGGDVFIQAKSGENSAKFTHDGNVELYYDNSKKFETDSLGTIVTGRMLLGDSSGVNDHTLKFGDSGDLLIYHDGTDNHIVSTNGQINIQTNSTKNAIQCIPDGQVKLFHDNTLQVSTSSTGIAFEDSKKANFGGENDLQIYHDGSNSYIDDSGTGNLLVRGNNIELHKYTGEDYLKCIANGAVELYYDNSKKVETTANGLKLSNLPDNAFMLLDQSGRQSSFNNYFSSSSTGSKISVDISTGATDGTRTRSVDFWPDGMSFNGDTASANRLDDYEEGTYTPKLRFSNNLSADDPVSFNSRSGSYTKIGRQVHVRVFFNIANLNGETGNLYLTLPISALSNHLGVLVGDGFQFGTGNYFAGGFGLSSGSLATIGYQRENVWSHVTENHIGGGGMYFEITYFV